MHFLWLFQNDIANALFFQVFDGKDACVTPVLTRDEAPHHPHNADRKSFVPTGTEGQYEPVPAPRLSRTPGSIIEDAKSPVIGQHTLEILSELGYSQEDIKGLIQAKAVMQAKEKSRLWFVPCFMVTNECYILQEGANMYIVCVF